MEKTVAFRRRGRAAAGVAWLSCPGLVDEAVEAASGHFLSLSD